ncbi:MAG: hypothetical protein V1889_02935 [archaeon]
MDEKSVRIIQAGGLELIRISPSEKIHSGDVINIDDGRKELVWGRPKYREVDYNQERLPFSFDTISQSERGGKFAVLYKIYNELFFSDVITGLDIGLGVPEGLYLRFKSDNDVSGYNYGWVIDNSEARQREFEALKNAGLWENKK